MTEKIETLSAKKLAAAILLASITASLFVTYAAVQIPQAGASHFIEISDTSPLNRRPYGFVPLFSEDGHALPDNTVLFDMVNRISPTVSPSTILNPNGASGLSPTDVYTAVSNGAANWALSSAFVNTEMPAFTNPTWDNGAIASLIPECNSSNSTTPNNRWEIDICELDPQGFDLRGKVETYPSYNSGAANGFIDQHIEADMAIDVKNVFSNWDIEEMEDVSTHEHGHFYGLGDVYNMWLGQACSGSAEEGPQGPPVMCWDEMPVEKGDINGLYYLYPKLNTFDFPDAFVNNNIDAAVHRINLTSGQSNANTDMITVITDRDSGTGTNHIKIRPLIDIHPDTYARTLGVTETLYSVSSGTLRDVGLAIGNVDNAADNRDMVVGYTDPQGRFKFRTYFDISLTNNDLGFSGFSAEQTILPSTGNHHGIDMVMLNMDGDAREEMMLFSTEVINSVRYIHHWLVEFNNDGTVASSTAFTGNTVGIEHNEIGSGVVDAANRKIAVMANAEEISTDEYVGYKVLVFNSGGALNTYTERRVGPIERTDELGGTLDGFGGDAFASNNMGSSNPEIYFIFADNDIEEFYRARLSLGITWDERQQQ